MLMVLPFPCNLYKLISSHKCRISRQWVKMLLFYAIWFLSSSPFVVGIITNELALNPGKQSIRGAKEADYNYIISVLTLKVYVLLMHFTGYKQYDNQRYVKKGFLQCCYKCIRHKLCNE